MAKFGLVRSFQIDGGQLDGLSPQMVFVLGYELADFDRKMKTKKPFRMTIHAENFQRCQEWVIENRRSLRSIWSSEDISEGWVDLQVF